MAISQAYERGLLKPWSRGEESLRVAHETMTNRIAKRQTRVQLWPSGHCGATGAAASINSLQRLTKLERFEIQAFVSL